MATDQSEAEAQTALGLARLNSQLEVDLENGLSFDESLAKWRVGEKIRVHRKQLFEVALPWWLYVRNPYWVARFEVRRTRSRRASASTSITELDALDGLLARAEFIRALPSTALGDLREKIRSKTLTQWHAVSLLNSYGCNITAEGALVPARVGKPGLVTGGSLAALLAAMFVLVAASAIEELASSCTRSCILIGASQAMILIAGAFLTTRSLTWGRAHKARQFAKIFAYEHCAPVRCSPG
jgi:hypothetical protein